MLINVPLMIVPFVVYNLVAARLIGGVEGDPWAQAVWTQNMFSGAEFVFTLGHLMIVVGLILLFFEIIKATRVGASTIIDHLLSTFVFIAFLVEFLLYKQAAHPVFFILMVITLVDVVAGFSVSIRSATRDVALGDGL